MACMHPRVSRQPTTRADADANVPHRNIAPKYIC